MTEVLAPFKNFKAYPASFAWSAPANIALVKYWGKKGHQLPANPSLSMTLERCQTFTHASFLPSEELSVRVFLDDKEMENFSEKIKQHLLFLSKDIPELEKINIEVRTTNTFPHSAGIASSASSMAAWALCLSSFLWSGQGDRDCGQSFYDLAGNLARLASGSACRSLFGGFVSWGKSLNVSSSDLTATQIDVHQSFLHLQDTILVVEDSPKKVSSSLGHTKMGEHPLASGRYEQARLNHQHCLEYLKQGDVFALGKLIEMEALMLHALMMSSPEPFILMKPNTLSIIKLIQDFRIDTGLPLFFTLDAGPNLHLIYKLSDKPKIWTFIQQELKPFVLTIIDDAMGSGPKRL
jgi:diphosphomevalonate decarboxylase